MLLQYNFHRLCPLGQVSLVVAMSVTMDYICMSPPLAYVLGLSLALRSHDQFPGLTLPHTPFLSLFFPPPKKNFTTPHQKKTLFCQFLSVFISVLLSANIKRVSVSRMRHFFCFFHLQGLKTYSVKAML